MSDEVLSREERIEKFGVEQVEHTEWWSKEMNLVDDVSDCILKTIDNRDDARLTKIGKSVDCNGEHKLRIDVEIAGNPWQREGGERR